MGDFKDRQPLSGRDYVGSMGEGPQLLVWSILCGLSRIKNLARFRPMKSPGIVKLLKGDLAAMDHIPFRPRKLRGP